MENAVRVALFLEKISGHPTLSRLSQEFPELAPERIFDAFERVHQEKGRRLFHHVLALGEHLEEICAERGVGEIDRKNALIAVLYHDFAKVSDYLDIDSNILLLKILKLEAGHSASAIRLFLYLDDLVLAQALRHNSTDFAIDISRNAVNLPQLLLNLVDKTDSSGARVTIAEKLDIVRGKLRMDSSYDERAEIIACDYLEEAMQADDFIKNGFATRDQYERRVLFLQRFDGKYCAPVGIYKDTSSNLKVAEYLAQWGYHSTILHEGNFETVKTKNLEVRSLPKSANPCVPSISHGYDLVVVEGSTERVKELAGLIGPGTGLVLLLRTFIDGHLTPRRLRNSMHADELWVMTRHMREVIQGQLENGETKDNVPDVKMLQSGISINNFFPPDSVSERIPGKITYVGALAELKGVDVLIQAFRNIRKEFPHAVLHLIGGKEIYGPVNEFSEEYLSMPGIIAHGVLDAASIADHLRSAHVSTLLTKKYETFGKSAMQARACGTRMIVSSNGALPFHVQNKEEGIVLDTVDVESVEKALREILSTEPETVLPEPGRYHPWIVTALDFHSHCQMLERKVFQRMLPRTE